ncbi:RED-like protein N-terminal region-domain-containing protein [Gautieria morchelliformis]|nr:RED-like protein N-terminal region-domain-containing protein [Gautieria morchelliformis]
MDQESFRKLLTTSQSGSLLTPSDVAPLTKKATINVSEPAFQPRKVKKRKTISEYRDRASERRAGVNDYAEVESVLEDFEKKTAAIEDRDAVEEQRRYLGGDKDHTILVKGLDFALLEQNKAREMAAHEDDESLEAAFQEAQPKKPLVPKKRTREDLIRELKEKRIPRSTDATKQGPTTDQAFEEAKKVGKFKPIGAPDHSTDQYHAKGAKGKGRDTTGHQNKRKRRKIKQGPPAATNSHDHNSPLSQTNTPTTSDVPKGSSLPSVETSTGPTGAVNGHGARLLDPDLSVGNDDEIDIFADAGEYEGVDFGEDEDGEQPTGSVNTKERVRLDAEMDGPATVKRWFTEDEPDLVPGPSIASPPPAPIAAPEEQEQEQEQEQVTRLVPLASSALPSISEFLTMDAQAEAQKKRKAKKEKKKGGEKKEKTSTEVKVDRDYKKLNSYLAKKGDVSKGV